MLIELKLFLYIYCAFLVIWFLLGYVGVYHMMKFGFRNMATFLATFFFTAVAVLILYASFYYLQDVDWSRQINLFYDVNQNTLNI